MNSMNVFSGSDDDVLSRVHRGLIGDSYKKCVEKALKVCYNDTYDNELWIVNGPSKRSWAWSKRIVGKRERDNEKIWARPRRSDSRATALWKPTERLCWQFSTQNIFHSSFWRRGKVRKTEGKLQPSSSRGGVRMAWVEGTVDWQVWPSLREFSPRLDWRDEKCY